MKIYFLKIGLLYFHWTKREEANDLQIYLKIDHQNSQSPGYGKLRVGSKDHSVAYK